ncbi:MAG: hypothetical protein EOP14_05960 [Pseudomonas sp.]|nr:MAG: hypothetical protein EOP14_05960 [Pseudomonas sp.]
MISYRERVRLHVELLAAPGEQAEYQAKVPAVNVVNELVNQWFDDLYQPTFEAFSSEFTAQELEHLHQFSQDFEAVLPSIPDTLALFHASSSSLAVASLAKQLHQSINW